MQTEIWARGNETGDLSALLEGLDHRRKIDVCKVHRCSWQGTFPHPEDASRTANSRSPMLRHAPVSIMVIAPVLLRIAKRLNVAAEARHDTVRIDVRLIVEKELLDDVGLVAEAQDEILVPVLAVIAHEMPEDRLAADRDHGLRNVFGVVADPRPESSAEQDCLHEQIALSNGRCYPAFRYSPTHRVGSIDPRRYSHRLERHGLADESCR